MKIVLAGTMAAVAAMLALASTSREQDPSGRSSAVPPAASSSSAVPPAPDALPPGATGGPRPPQPQGATSSAGSEPVSYQPSQAEAVPTDAPAVSDAQVAALQQLVEQSRQENERLAQINDELASARRQSASQEYRVDAEAEQAAARHAATLEALDVLRQADALLATGDSDGVDDELGHAEAALTGRTRIDVDAAREALGRSDLYAARVYLTAALAERRSLR